MTLGTSWESDTRGGSAKVERGAKRKGRRTPSVLLTFWEPPCDAPRAAVRVCHATAPQVSPVEGFEGQTTAHSPELVPHSPRRR